MEKLFECREPFLRRIKGRYSSVIVIFAVTTESGVFRQPCRLFFLHGRKPFLRRIESRGGIVIMVFTESMNRGVFSHTFSPFFLHSR